MRALLVFVLVSVSISSFGQDRGIYFSGGMGYSDLFKVDQDGKELSRLTTKESRGEYQPQVSPDGKKVVFNTYRYGGWKLAVADLDDEGEIIKNSVRKLVRNSSGYEYDGNWSKDGRQIIYIGFERGNSGFRQLFITDLDGNSQQITNTGYAHYSPNFADGGNRIYCSVIQDGIFRLMQIDIETNAAIMLTAAEDMHEVSPAISPNGRYLAFHGVHDDESLTVRILDLKSLDQKVLYGTKEEEKNFLNRAWQTPLFSYGIGWSSDSEEIVFTAHLGDSVFELYKANIKTGQVTQITKLKEASTQPSWF